jgi:hypothetical protein
MLVPVTDSIPVGARSGTDVKNTKILALVVLAGKYENQIIGANIFPVGCPLN